MRLSLKITVFYLLTLIPIALLADDYKLYIYAIADWKGNLDVEDDGRSGIAALHTFIQKKKEWVKEPAGFLFLHTGDLTGAKTEDEFKKIHFREDLVLYRYTNFDAFLAKSTDVPFLIKFNNTDRLWKQIPYLSFNSRDEIKKQRILAKGPLNIFITGITEGKEPAFDTSPYERLKMELNRQKGSHLTIILGEKELTDEIDEKLYGQEILRWNIPEKETWQAVYFTPGKTGRFYRMKSGLHVCRISGREICEMELHFRKGYIISVTQRFFYLNDDASSWVKADPLLLKSYRGFRGNPSIVE